MAWICGKCERVVSVWESACVRCSARCSFTEIADTTVTLHKASSVAHVVVPRVASTLDAWQALTQGGLPYGTVTVLYGVPTAGKSTLAMQLTKGLRSVYLSSERPLYAVASECKRLGCVSSELFLAYDTNAKALCEAVQPLHPELVVLDSWQRAEWPGIDAKRGTYPHMARILESFIHLARSTPCAVILVGQVTKKGTVRAHSELLHEVDALVQLKRDVSSFGRTLVTDENSFRRRIHTAARNERRGSALTCDRYVSYGATTTTQGPPRPRQVALPLRSSPRS